MRASPGLLALRAEAADKDSREVSPRPVCGDAEELPQLAVPTSAMPGPARHRLAMPAGTLCLARRPPGHPERIHKTSGLRDPAAAFPKLAGCGVSVRQGPAEVPIHFGHVPGTQTVQLSSDVSLAPGTRSARS
jgi:hypothetical protein